MAMQKDDEPRLVIASREILARRLAISLTGLPPQPDGPQLRSNRAPDVARYVDALLATPAYGEHIAVAWLDLARYADTHGYHIDGHRDMWRWRDWVLESINQGMSFRQFTILQLAGDLLPPAATRYASMRQHLASGFMRNTPINSEDGAIAEEFLAEYAAERTMALGTAWLGLTMQCCRCHDHKNDPTTQAEFYQLSAFFNDLPELGIDGRHGNAAPVLAAPTLLQERAWQAALQRQQELRSRQETEIARGDAASRRDQQEWEDVARRSGPRPGPVDATGRLLLYEGQGRRLAASPAPRPAASPAPRPAAATGPAARLLGTPVWLPSQRRRVEDRSPNQPHSLAMRGNQRIEWQLPAGDAFTLTAWLKLTTSDPMTVMAAGSPPLELQLNSKGAALIEGGEVVHQAPPAKQNWPRSKWRQVAWTFANRTHQIYLSGEPLLTYREPVSAGARTGDERTRWETGLHATIGGAESSVEGSTGLRGMIDEVIAFGRALEPDELKRLANADPLLPALLTSPAERSPAERHRVRVAFLMDHDAAFAKRQQEIQSLSRELAQMKAAFPTSMVMVSGTARESFVLQRGDYRRPRQRVDRDVPGWLPPLQSAGEKPTRLDLARWLTSADHPLTARVVANRIWQQHFGAPLVSTPDDFGLGGAAPRHPALLDFLASELMRCGWDEKALHRLIVTSATFLQETPRLPGETARVRFLAAETLRDSALSVSGLLSNRVGGPSVFPYQPAGLWEELARDPNLYSAQTYREDDGEGLYRRSIYTFWKRSAPPPLLELLGAPTRETCSAARGDSQGSQRALALLNEPIFVESSRVLATKLLAMQSHDAALQKGVESILSRAATDAELQVLKVLWQDLAAHYRTRTAAAEALIRVGRSETPSDANAVELAAWTAWCNTLMNTLEFQTIP